MTVDPFGRTGSLRAASVHSFPVLLSFSLKSRYADILQGVRPNSHENNTALRLMTDLILGARSVSLDKETYSGYVLGAVLAQHV